MSSGCAGTGEMDEAEKERPSGIPGLQLGTLKTCQRQSRMSGLLLLREILDLGFIFPHFAHLLDAVPPE